MVTETDIIRSFQELGVQSDDVLLIHSSMKSFGYVDGGPETVISGLKKVVHDGTLVFPTLRSRQFYNAYRDWDILNTPSDVGLLSETFRTSPGVLRSDQETHSVAAFGKQAKYITEGHRTGKPRVGIFGDLAFGYNSPWQRMYDLNAVVVMIGISMVYNTFKHYVEYCMVDDILFALTADERIQAQSELSKFNPNPPDPNTKPTPNGKPAGVWFWHDGQKAQDIMASQGKVNFGRCGDATLTCFRVRDFFDFMYHELRFHPRNWLDEPYYKWIEKYDKNGDKYDY